ncbi:hypothetical protein A2634_01060 [Candidatus Amesbacteria bacterium RIFCSPHIGHO2_01_FULL_48_32]|uniref:Uncharacterized protein n=1 Tax=Candidatus Amesbacteria bacterium RIFCSPLOWO2_01_FULL_48_25 TaxID=1797259 RepID=A0A1F4ZB94_9BACT|nr:MAG: hypothetical protein A2634_01060 [Candidatus Amesbacteria bacterium RIFCSPHIGHO2_01_FULL_48_32]OGD03629.1 MAG: hypothetical protein A2989_03040 [Candidatus Amesbacteria bacterium RIFCSPLOWO2_01_FULL_48_25]HJZ06024.1 hypothetical protein [Patescibacteria group bacterium]
MSIRPPENQPESKLNIPSWTKLAAIATLAIGTGAAILNQVYEIGAGKISPDAMLGVYCLGGITLFGLGALAIASQN